MSTKRPKCACGKRAEFLCDELRPNDDFTVDERRRATGPLRLVLGTVTVPGAMGLVHELYECGHTRLPKQDMAGPTNAYRRRCRRCALGLAPEPAFLAEAQRRAVARG